MSTTRGTRGEFALAVHGGAGTIRRDETTGARASSHHKALHRALAAGCEVLAVRGMRWMPSRAAIVLDDEPLSTREEAYRSEFRGQGSGSGVRGEGRVLAGEGRGMSDSEQRRGFAKPYAGFGPS